MKGNLATPSQTHQHRTEQKKEKIPPWTDNQSVNEVSQENVKQRNSWLQTDKLKSTYNRIECFALETFSVCSNRQSFGNAVRCVVCSLFFYSPFFIHLRRRANNFDLTMKRVVHLPPICFSRSSSSSNLRTAELAKFKGLAFSSQSTLLLR